MRDDPSHCVMAPLTQVSDLTLEALIALLAADATYTARPIQNGHGLELLAPLPDLDEQTQRRRRWILARLAAGQPRDAEPEDLAALIDLLTATARAEGWRVEQGPEGSLLLHPATKDSRLLPITASRSADGLVLRAPLRLLPVRSAPPCVRAATVHVLFQLGADARPARLRLVDPVDLTIAAETHLPADQPSEDEIRWVLHGLCAEGAEATPILAALRSPAVALEVAAAHSLPVPDREPLKED